MARIEVGFPEAVAESEADPRDFQCDARVTAGSRRLTTDRDHAFEISFWATDGYSPIAEVHAATVTQVLDLAPGQTATLSSEVYPGIRAADGVSYACRVTYIQQ